MDIKLKNIGKYRAVDFMICAGDLTQNGLDGKGGLKIGCFPPIYHHRSIDELSIYIQDYEKKVESVCPLYVCPGNHDTYCDRPVIYKGVLKHIANKHGATYNPVFWKSSGMYTFQHKGVKFISCGIYPYNLNWLTRHLPKNKQDPIILFWHYNTLIGEPFSDWWSTEEKEAFYRKIQEYNVLMIVNGHLHNTTLQYWHDIPIVKGAGSSLAIVHMKGTKVHEVYFDNGQKPHKEMEGKLKNTLSKEENLSNRNFKYLKSLKQDKGTGKSIKKSEKQEKDV